MENKDLVDVVINVLTALITGGFIIVLIEIKNRHSRAFADYRDLMIPFLKKVSVYCRFIAYYEPVMALIDDSIKGCIDKIRKEGVKIINEGRDLSMVDLNYKDVEKICKLASEIGSCQSPVRQIRLNEIQDHKCFLESELSKLDSKFLAHMNDIRLLGDVSNYFYKEIYESMVSEKEDCKLKIKLYNVQSNIVLSMIVIIIVMLVPLIFLKVCFWVVYVVFMMVLLMFFLSLLLLCVNEYKQLESYHSIKEVFAKNSKKK